MKKSIFYSILFTLVFFCIPCLINAETYDAVIKTNSTVNVRKGAGTGYSSIFSLGNGTSIKVLDKTKYSGSGCSAGWYKIEYKDKVGYTCSTYVTFIDTIFEGINVMDYTARVTGNNVAVRKSASSSATILERLSLGANVTILGESGSFYKIKYYGDSVGYMSKDYIRKKSEIIKDDPEYHQTLKDAGFPDSYIPYLTHLHSKYPNWQFIAKDTKLSFPVAVNSEVGLCYMQTTNPNYISSSKPAEGSSWYYVNSGVVAFYMDPRNWLTEERIFMFEKLDYTESLESTYPTLAKSIFGGGKLGGDEYINAMVNAGRANKISPVHIASRIRLEVGANGSDSTNGCEFTWKGKKYSGYYNFFNIGAYETTIDGVEYGAITRGLAYAAKLIKREGELWNNIETAILEGSNFLADGYVNSGQGTLYYQKFNVSPNAHYDTYTHQYQTNIQAPAVEGNSAYNSFKSNKLLDSTFVFEIPVYNNLPAVTSLPKSGDTNNYLKSLSVDSYPLTPSFDEDILDYEVFVPTSISKINVNAVAQSAVSTIEGIGEVELKDNETTITITVTSEVGEKREYTITAKLVEDTTKVSDVLSDSSLVLKNGTIYKISPDTTVTTLKNKLIKNGAQNVIFKNSKGTEMNGSTKLTTNSSITITTAMETLTYKISIKGDTNGDGQATIIDLLQVQKHIKNDKKLTNASLIAADTNFDGKVTIVDLLQVQKHIKKDKKL